MVPGAKTDDAIEDRNGIATVNNGETIAMGYYEGASGFRFYSQSLQQIKGKTITSAYLIFQSSENSDNKVKFNIYAQASSTCKTFEATNKNLTSRPKTTPLLWDQTTTAWSRYWPLIKTPDISTILSQVTKNISDWDGINLCFLIINNGGANYQDRYVYANEGIGTSAQLEITYQP